MGNLCVISERQAVRKARIRQRQSVAAIGRSLRLVNNNIYRATERLREYAATPPTTVQDEIRLQRAARELIIQRSRQTLYESLQTNVQNIGDLLTDASVSRAITGNVSDLTTALQSIHTGLSPSELQRTLKDLRTQTQKMSKVSGYTSEMMESVNDSVEEIVSPEESVDRQSDTALQSVMDEFRIKFTFGSPTPVRDPAPGRLVSQPTRDSVKDTHILLHPSHQGSDHEEDMGL